MKIIQIAEFGDPRQVARCIEAPEPPEPGPDEVLIQTLACPIHPADVMLIRGTYLRLPPLPLVPGIEASGRILRVGRDVKGLKSGDTVLSLARQTWVERRTLKATEVVSIGADVDPLQLAMLYLNPLTAWMMLSRPEIVTAGEDGIWIIQNAANSSVARWVDWLAPRFGVKVLNVVRRPDALDGTNAENVVVDGTDLAQRVRDRIGNARLIAGLDAISGNATGRLAASLSPGGTIFVYGNLAEAPVAVANEDLLFRGVHVTGFSVTRTTTSMERGELVKPLDIFADVIKRGFRQEIEATFPFENISAAVAQAMQGRRRGKILVTSQAG